jgi:hypothetical protein
MKNSITSLLLFVFLIASVCAQPGDAQKTLKDKQTPKHTSYIFGQVKDWKPNPEAQSNPEPLYRLLLSETDPIIAEGDNFCRFVVVPSGAGKHRDFSVSVIVNGREHILLKSKEAFSDENGFYFQFSPKEIGPLPKGKHKLMLVIDRGKTTLVRNETNQHSLDFTVK